MNNENFIRLMTTFSFDIDSLPDYLKCIECKYVLKDAYQVQCGCQLCLACIDNVMARGIKFCQGDSEECCETPLSTAQRDYNTNKSILKLIATCPQSGCSYKCQLLDMGNHLQMCQRNSVDCPFREFGCLHGPLAAEEISDHLQQESCSHSEILIGVVSNINKDIEKLKLSDLASKQEIEKLNHELVLKDEQMKMIIDEMRHLQNENKAIKGEIISVKQEKEVLSDQVKQLLEKLEREMDERCEIDELDCTEEIESIRDRLETEVEPIKAGIRSTNRNTKLIKGNHGSAKTQLQSKQVLGALGHVDARCDDWMINATIGKKDWGWGSCGPIKASEKFTGTSFPYTYQLAVGNYVFSGALCIRLRVFDSPIDNLLEWPFRGAVTITVAHRERRETCSRQTRQCIIKKPPENRYKISEEFVFRHFELENAGLDLGRGVRISCQIIPGTRE